jgi:hypothetical protein
MLINEKHIMLEAGIQVRLESKLDYYRIMMAVNMRVNSVKSLEELTHETWESFREWDSYGTIYVSLKTESKW